METFAWPIAVIVIAVVAMLIFRKPLERLLDRIKKIGTTGIDTTASEQTTAKSEVGPSAADEFAKLFDNQLLVQREKSIRAALTPTVGPDYTSQEETLLRIIAAQAIKLQFEMTYRSIFGSQLNALQTVNPSPDGVELQIFETLYNQAAELNKAMYADYSFEQWLEYMEHQSLVIRKDDKVCITLDGREFLQYLIHQGYTLYKYG